MFLGSPLLDNGGRMVSRQSREASCLEVDGTNPFVGFGLWFQLFLLWKRCGFRYMARERGRECGGPGGKRCKLNGSSGGVVGQSVSWREMTVQVERFW